MEKRRRQESVSRLGKGEPAGERRGVAQLQSTMASLRSPSLPLLASLALTFILAVGPVTSTNAEDEQVAVGRVEPADPNDKEVQKAVKFAVKTYNDMNNDLYISRPIRVMSASQQVVAGKNFYLKIELGRTTCSKSQSDLSDCPFYEQPDQQMRVICNFQIYSVSWENKMSVTNFNSNKRLEKAYDGEDLGI
ncbi:cystatin-C-like protein [Cricetulus griseus]|uniref:Cystatin-C-like protein n=1 Tax=Cricetulus griseus TaxID=10029 RepID=A0A061HXZ5_CRIGR|nr:cystatin-C-like protein [Cricetulus griseus]